MEYDRRTGIDRRAQARLNVRMLAGSGHRRTIRRREDKARIYLVDRYSSTLFLTLLSISFLCIIDALFTLYLLEHGAYETNPIMAYLLNIGPYAFIIPKYVLTIFGILGLLLFRGIAISKLNVNTHWLLHLMAWLYVSVVAWELYLIYQAA